MPANPALPDDMGAWKRSVERRLKELATGVLSRPPLNRITGGYTVIEDGGGLEIRSPSGVLLLRIGDLGDDLAYADGTRQFGMIVCRSDGSNAIIVADPAPEPDGQRQFAAMIDSLNHIIVADDLNGNGLSRPFLPIHFAPSTPDGHLTSSGSFVRLLEAYAYRQHPSAIVIFSHSTTDAGTTGEARLMLEGVQVGATVSVGFGSAYAQFGYDVPGPHEGAKFHEVQVRRTAGTGQVFASVVLAYGTGQV